MNTLKVRLSVALSLAFTLTSGGVPLEVQAQLSQTSHAALPASASELWLVPAEGDRTRARRHSTGPSVTPSRGARRAMRRFAAAGLHTGPPGDRAGGLRELLRWALTTEVVADRRGAADVRESARHETLRVSRHRDRAGRWWRRKRLAITPPPSGCARRWLPVSSRSPTMCWPGWVEQPLRPVSAARR